MLAATRTNSTMSTPLLAVRWQRSPPIGPPNLGAGEVEPARRQPSASSSTGSAAAPGALANVRVVDEDPWP